MVYKHIYNQRPATIDKPFIIMLKTNSFKDIVTVNSFISINLILLN